MSVGIVFRLRQLAIQLGLLSATILCFDVLAFHLIPPHMTEHLPLYREGRSALQLLGRGYPRHYFVAHPDRGFDIKPMVQPRKDQWHRLDDEGIAYQIWSNKLGCFDRDHSLSGQQFIYFAGDSTTWGYAPFNSKFGTVFERIAKINVLKCGVSHTGQRHQFSKFAEIASKLQRWPSKVVVFYSPNDVANDYAYPHSTVVDGGLIDKVWLDETNGKVELGQDWINHAVSRAGTPGKTRAAASKTSQFVSLLLTYSMSAQLLNSAMHYTSKNIPALATTLSPAGQNPFLHWFDQFQVFKDRKIFDIHRLSYQQSNAGTYRYGTFSYAAANKDALLKWRDHAARFSYKLEIVLMPPGEVFGTQATAKGADFYKELKSFLNDSGIRFHDIAAELRYRGIKPSGIFWKSDPHPSIEGNILLGKLLAELL